MEIKIIKEEDVVENVINDAYKYAAIYARESNVNATNAIDTQLQVCKDYAFKNNILIYETYSEFISGAQVSYKARKEFVRLLQDAQKGYFKKIIVTRRDRLSRRFEDFLEIKNMLKKLDVEIIYSNDIQVDEKKDYACNFIENILMGLAEMEPRRISNRIKAGKSFKIQQAIYDKKAPFGLIYNKNKEQYNHHGIKADVVRDIFNIYISYKTVKNLKDVIKILYKKCEKRENEKEIYTNLVKKLKVQDIKNILSRSIYAALQLNDIDYKYKDFHVIYEGIPNQVDLKYFQKSRNVEEIISTEQWFKAVEKYYEHNLKDKKKIKNKKRENAIFKDLFICSKCNKTLKYRKGKFTCETKGCKSINKDILIRDTIKLLVEYLIYNNKENEAISSIVKKLNSEISMLKKQLSESINEQSKLVQKYIENASNEENKNDIIKKVKNQEKIKRDINELNEKINFLNNKFKDIIIPLTKSNYIHIIADELEKNQQALLELFMYENIRELRINEHPITINQRK